MFRPRNNFVGEESLGISEVVEADEAAVCYRASETSQASREKAIEFRLINHLAIITLKRPGGFNRSSQHQISSAPSG